jgi:hypothetical protein
MHANVRLDSEGQLAQFESAIQTARLVAFVRMECLCLTLTLFETADAHATLVGQEPIVILVCFALDS